VKTQLSIAMSACALLAIMRKRIGMQAIQCQFLQILSVTLFEKALISYRLHTGHPDSNFAEYANQLILLDL
jgi:hypothetical protein